jgi:hypothetical protein
LKSQYVIDGNAKVSFESHSLRQSGIFPFFQPLTLP